MYRSDGTVNINVYIMHRSDNGAANVHVYNYMYVRDIVEITRNQSQGHLVS